MIRTAGFFDPAWLCTLAPTLASLSASAASAVKDSKNSGKDSIVTNSGGCKTRPIRKTALMIFMAQT